MLVLKSLVGVHRTVQLQLLQHYWLDYRDIEWFALEPTEIILSFLRLHPSTASQTLFVDYDVVSVVLLKLVICKCYSLDMF